MTTEWFGHWGVSKSGAMRKAILGPPMCRCYRCGKETERHRIFDDTGSGYRNYVDGDYCYDCARCIAEARNAEQEAVERKRIEKSWYLDRR